MLALSALRPGGHARSEVRARVVDISVAAGLAILGLGNLLVIRDEGGLMFDGLGPAQPPPVWVAAALVLVQSLPLATRRVGPVMTLAVVMAAWLTSYAIAAMPTMANLGVLIAVYTAVAYAEGQARRLLAVVGLPVATLTAALFLQRGMTASQAAGVVLFLGMFAFVGLLQHQRRRVVAELERAADAMRREREERARRAVLEEQIRIGRELHDVIGQALSVIAVQTALARRTAGRDVDATTRTLTAVESTARSALRQMRDYLAGFPESADLPPGLDKLAELTDAASAAGLEVELDLPDPLPQLIAETSMCAYRVVQEALTNVLRHANARAVRISLRQEGDSARLTIRDDGARRPPAPPGRGLRGLSARVEACGGSFSAGPSMSGGFVVEARLPLAPLVEAR